MDWTLELVVVPVSDVDRAKRFHRHQVAFAVDHDSAIGDEMRVVQLTPAGPCRSARPRDDPGRGITLAGRPAGTVDPGSRRRGRT